MDNTEKRREATADAGGEVEIEMVPNGPGKWILHLVVPERLEIRRGDVVCIDRALIPFSQFEVAEAEPEDVGGDEPQTR